ncbi:MAG: YfiR family protein [Bacteroidales bacterium]|jgi:hypothetical protein|nr:YfiR family protein [Bacteroidales bacterium]MBP5419245.1 YfiR family protein [Bacteroidales bacterium]MCR5697345.1 YfiR family protein [Marinilabiliaceae bacterium]
MLNTKKILLVGLITLFALSASAQGMAKFQALFIYNFAKNIGWPAGDEGKDLVITVIGDSEVESQLVGLSKTQKVGSRNVVVKSAAAATGLVKSDIIYLGESKSNLVSKLVSAQEGNPSLIVTGKSGLCANGAGISFVAKGGKLNFEISNGNISKKGLKVSNKLLQLGTAVD